MSASIWSATLESFSDAVAGSTPAPAAVAVSAVTASLGLGLLIKVLEITSRRKSFAGDPQMVMALVDRARRASAELKAAADDDVEAVREYMASRGPDGLRNAIEIPMRAARAAAAGLDLCSESVGIIDGILVADLRAAALLISAAMRSILVSVDFNVRYARAEEEYCAAIAAECRVLENRADMAG